MSSHDQSQGPLDPSGPGGIDAPAPPGGPQRTDAPAGEPPDQQAADDAVHDETGTPPRGRPADDTGIEEAAADEPASRPGRQQENAATTGDEPSQ